MSEWDKMHTQKDFNLVVTKDAVLVFIINSFPNKNNVWLCKSCFNDWEKFRVNSKKKSWNEDWLRWFNDKEQVEFT